MSLHLTLKNVLPRIAQACGVAQSLVPRRVIPPLWREAGAGSLLLDMLSEGSGQPQPRQADGPPVMLVPGLFAGAASLAPLADNLRDQGWAVHPSGIRSNVGCSAGSCSSS